MSTEQMRRDFEKWANKLASISITGFLEWQGDSYVDDYHQRLWQAWQASRAAPVVELPEPFQLANSHSGIEYYYVSEVDKALRAAGITVKE